MWGRLSELQKKHGLNNAEVAEIAGVSVRSYIQWTVHGHAPKTQPLIALADYYSVSLDYLCGRASSQINSAIPDHLLTELIEDIEYVYLVDKTVYRELWSMVKDIINGLKIERAEGGKDVFKDN